jgi:hypothetical protein
LKFSTQNRLARGAARLPNAMAQEPTHGVLFRFRNASTSRFGIPQNGLVFTGNAI